MKPSRRRVDVFLGPGELTVHSAPVSIKTIVGSCVAVCLWDCRQRIGGVNHFLLPRPYPSDPPDARFGTVATAQLIERVRGRDGTRRQLEASVVGGARPAQASRRGSVGEANTAVALAVLREHGIRVVRQETGGVYGRKLLFNTQTGKLIVRCLPGSAEQAGARTSR